MFKNIIIALFLILILLNANAAIAWACDKPEYELPPMEPEKASIYFVDDNIVGVGELYVRMFDLNLDGRIDYMTGRKIFERKVDEHGNTIPIPSPWEAFNPLFYWYDRNGNGKFEDWLNEMWYNPETDGNCENIKFYNFLTE